MNCGHWNESIVGRLYEENSAETDAALETHLGGCAACRATLEEFRRVRTVLAADEPAVPRVPRVVVLRDRARWRPALMAASILGAALLGGAGAGAGYALGLRRAPAAPSAAATAGPTAVPASLDAETQALIRHEVEQGVAAAAAARSSTRAATGDETRRVVTAADLRAEMARFERKINDSRAADLDYMLGQIEASEIRTGTRIGKTNQALRSVALASNGYVSAQ